MKLDTSTLPHHFTIATPSNSHFDKVTNCFDFIDNKSNILLVTVGDSWTWGQDLVPEKRLQQVYGRLVSDYLKSDWLNLGQSGSNNFFIAERIEELGNIVDRLHYQKIIVVCTFTETGRSFNSDHDRYLDYHAWFKRNNIKNFLYFLNNECYKRILAVCTKNKMTLRIGTNFVDPIGFPVDFPPWYKQLGIDSHFKSCVGSTGAKRLTDVKQFVQNQKIYKEWISNVIELSKFTDEICQNNILKNCHPDHDGHAIWAASIIESLK